MNFKKLLAPLAILVFTIGAWQAFQWAGIALAAGGVVMWVLLHFTRMVTILKKAANRPIGYVASAVMLNAKLKKGATRTTRDLHLDGCQRILRHLHFCGGPIDHMAAAPPCRTRRIEPPGLRHPPTPHHTMPRWTQAVKWSFCKLHTFHLQGHFDERCHPLHV
jgi:hypothetical protein